MNTNPNPICTGGIGRVCSPFLSEIMSFSPVRVSCSYSHAVMSPSLIVLSTAAFCSPLIHSCVWVQGIAKRTVTYVDWSNPRHASSPEKFTSHNITSQLIQKIQNRTENYDGQYIDSSDDSQHTLQSCVYNGQPHSPCFLFARKFRGEKEDVDAFLAIPKAVLGYW